MRNFLKIVILLLIIVESAFAVYGFFGAFAQGATAALISLAASLALIAPLVAVYLLLGEVEMLQIKVKHLEDEHIRKDIKENPPVVNEVPELQKGRNALTDWTCAKCGTVNKANTANCENCGSAY